MEKFITEMLWFVVGVVFFILELTNASFVLFFLGIGACATAVFCWLFAPSFGLQITAFLLFSMASIFFLRKPLKSRYIDEAEKAPQDELKDSFIGKTAKVIQRLTPEKTGTVELNGTLWKASSEEIIEKDQTVEIVYKNNITLFVKPLSLDL